MQPAAETFLFEPTACLTMPATMFGRDSKTCGQLVEPRPAQYLLPVTLDHRAPWTARVFLIVKSHLLVQARQLRKPTPSITSMLQ
jgi:hypothetical protein